MLAPQPRTTNRNRQPQQQQHSWIKKCTYDALLLLLREDYYKHKIRTRLRLFWDTIRWLMWWLYFDGQLVVVLLLLWIPRCRSLLLLLPPAPPPPSPSSSSTSSIDTKHDGNGRDRWRRRNRSYYTSTSLRSSFLVGMFVRGGDQERKKSTVVRK